MLACRPSSRRGRRRMKRRRRLNDDDMLLRRLLCERYVISRIPPRTSRLFRSCLATRARIGAPLEKSFLLLFLRVHLTWRAVNACPPSFYLFLSLSGYFFFFFLLAVSRIARRNNTFVSLSLSLFLESLKRTRRVRNASRSGASRRVADSSGSRSTLYIREVRSRGSNPASPPARPSSPWLYLYMHIARPMFLVVYIRDIGPSEPNGEAAEVKERLRRDVTHVYIHSHTVAHVERAQAQYPYISQRNRIQARIQAANRVEKRIMRTQCDVAHLLKSS